MQILGYVVYLVKCAHTDIFGSNHTSKFLAHPTKLSLSLPARKQLFYSQSSAKINIQKENPRIFLRRISCVRKSREGVTCVILLFVSVR